MNDAERAIEKIREIEDTIGELKGVRSEVLHFNINMYEDAGGALWAGQKRNSFLDIHETAKSNYAQIEVQIDQAIDECKSKQRSLAASINAAEHPILSARAWLLAA